MAPKLLKHERALWQLSYLYKNLYGLYDENSKFLYIKSKNIPINFFEQNILFTFRLFSDIEPFIKFPFIIQNNSNKTGAGLSDINFGFKTYFFDNFSFALSMQAPTGQKRDQNNKDPFNIFGLGYFIVFSNISFDSYFSDNFLYSISYNLGIPFKNTSLMHNTGFSLAYLLSLNTSINNNISFSYEHSIKRYKLNSSLGISKKLSSKISMLLSVNSDVPLAVLSKNNNNFFGIIALLKMGLF